MVLSDPMHWPDGMTVEHAHRIASMTTLATGLALVELLGIAGTWSFKRWGVYVLSGFAMFGFVLRLQTGDSMGASLGLVSIIITGLVVATSWKDFE